MSGYSPDNTDNRGSNIISAVTANRDAQNPTSTESARAHSKPPAPAVPSWSSGSFMDGVNNAPPMPNLTTTPPQFNAFDGGISREEVGKIVVGVLQNVSINGVYPTVSGGSIDFPISDNAAPSQWAQQNWLGVSLSTLTDNVPSSQANAAVVGFNVAATQDSKGSIIESSSQPVTDSKVGAINAGSAPVVDSKMESSNSGLAPITDSKVGAVNSGSAPVVDSKIGAATSSNTPITDSRIEVTNSRSRPVVDSNSEVTNSRSRPVVDSNSEVANSRSKPVTDSKIEVANSKATPLKDSDRRVANPMSNTLSRRRSNEQAGDVNTVTPLYVKSADGSSAMVVYMHEAHTISIDPDTTVGDTITDSMSNETIAPSQYFLSGGGGGEQFPFKISVTSGKNPKYKVSYNSSIINGTNGGPYSIGGLNLDKSLAQEKFIIAEATVPTNLVITGFTIKEVDAGETDEVVMSGTGSTATQSKLRLLIGKITVEDLPNNGGKLLRPWQAITTSYRTVNSFYNGVSVLVLEPAPTHQSRV